MKISDSDINTLLGPVSADKKALLSEFIRSLYDVYKANYFTYLEINPLVVSNGRIYVLDLAAKLDETAHFLCSELWKTRNGEVVEFPAPFGRDLTKEVGNFLRILEKFNF